MKKIFFLPLILLAILGLSCSKKDNSPGVSSTVWPSGVAARYQYDAWRMAYEYDTFIKSPYKDSIAIEKPLADTIMMVLAAIYNSRSPQRNVVIDSLDIHNYCDISLMQIMIFISDTAAGWSGKCWKGLYPTGNAVIDNCHTRFGLYTESQHGWATGPVAVLKTTTPINWVKFCDDLITGPTPAGADPDHCMGDGSFIHFYRETDHYKIIFDHGFGDCPSGCEHQFWQFNVYKNWKVKFIKSW